MTDSLRRNFLRRLSASFGAVALSSCGDGENAASTGSAAAGSPAPAPSPAPSPAPAPAPTPAPAPSPAPAPPAAPLLAEARRIAWQGNVGIPGGIPVRTTVYATLPPSGGDDTAAIQAALDNCPVDQVVRLAPGRFTIGRALTFEHKTLRGSGPGSTVIVGNFAGNLVEHNASFWGYGPDSVEGGIGPLIASGCVKGSTQIVLANAVPPTIEVSEFTGTKVQITESNDPTVVDTGGNGIAYAIGQWVSVTAIDRTTKTITFTPPLYRTYNAALTPCLRYPFNGAAGAAPYNFAWLAGIEDLTLRNEHPGAVANVRYNGAAYCWMQNVASENAATMHVWPLDSFRCEIRRCRFDGIAQPITSSRGYGICMGTPNGPYPTNKATAWLIEDNIFVRVRGAVVVGYGAAGNVVAYNYFVLPFDTQSPTIMKMDVSIHSSHAMFNLFEGNVGHKFDADFEHGGASDNTLYRNWWKGRDGDPLHVSSLSSINIAARQRRYNVVGNVLGTATIVAEVAALSPGTSVYEEAYPGAPSYGGTYKVFMLGYAGEGGGTGTHDTVAELDLLRHGNFDHVTATTRWDGAIASRSLPPSLYLAAAPAWWPAGKAWPPIGPDLAPMTTTLPAEDRYHAGA